MTYLRARYYNPSIRRFVQEDPARDQLDWYVYCANNPLRWVDKTGETITPANVVGGVIGAGSGAALGVAVANHYELKGAKRKATIAGFAVGGAVIGWFAGPVVTKLAKNIASSAGQLINKAGQHIFTKWQHAEKYLAKKFGGTSQMRFKVKIGGKSSVRIVDQFSKGIAHESKVGYVSLNQKIQTQIAKDAALLRSGQVEKVVWHFFESSKTGKIGASKKVLKELAKAGIEYVIGK